MTHEEKISYMALALSMMNLNIGKENLDKVVSVYELLLKKEGDVNIKDIVKLEATISEKYKVKPLKCSCK